MLPPGCLCFVGACLPAHPGFRAVLEFSQLLHSEKIKCSEKRTRDANNNSIHPSTLSPPSFLPSVAPLKTLDFSESEV